MAESSDHNLFNCPICIDLLKDPVTTACGHSFCMSCIKCFWDQESQKEVYSCPQCRQIFSQRPALNRSTVLAELIEKTKTEGPRDIKATPPMCSAGSGDVECDVCMETKLKAVKFCQICVAFYCESHIQTHYTSTALKRHKLVNASPHLLEQICSQHDKPLELYCCQDQRLICMQCALIDHQNHSMASPSAKRPEIQEQLQSNQHGLQEEIHQRELKVQEIKQAVDSHKRSAQSAVEISEKIFTESISSVGKKRAEIREKIRNQEKAEEKKAEELINTLEEEISDMRRRNEELGKLSQIDDDIYFIQSFSTINNYQCSNLCDITVNQRLTFDEIQSILTELKSQLEDLCEQDTVRIAEKIPTVHIMLNDKTITEYLPSQPKTREEFLIYSSKLSLNRQTASSELSLNNDNNVQRCDSLQSYNQPQHHNKYPQYNKYAFIMRPVVHQNSTYQVLCNESLSGCCYFEVEYTGTGCSVAFSYDLFSQAGGNFTFGCNNRSWIFNISGAGIEMSHNNSSTNIPIISSKIGVYLDHSAGTLSFYNVSDKMTLLQRVQTMFTEPLYPGFSLQKWGNGSSVVICDLPLKSK